MKVLNARNLYEMKQECYHFTGYWKDILGELPKNGAWLIYGREKHGKTSFALSLAKYLSGFDKVLYVSAEEGTDPLFVKAVKRAEIPATDQFGFLPYVPIHKLNERLKKRRAPKIVFIDNITVYNDELKRGAVKELIRENNNTLFVFLAHEERKEPSTAAGRLVKKLAKVIVRIEGLQATIGGRCPGGTLIIHEEKAEM